MAAMQSALVAQAPQVETLRDARDLKQQAAEGASSVAQKSRRLARPRPVSGRTNRGHGGRSRRRAAAADRRAVAAVRRGTRRRSRRPPARGSTCPTRSRSPTRPCTSCRSPALPGRRRPARPSSPSCRPWSSRPSRCPVCEPAVVGSPVVGAAVVPASVGADGSVEEAPSVPEESSLAVESSAGSRVGQPVSAVDSEETEAKEEVRETRH